MDDEIDDSCVMKLIEIVPAEDYGNCFELPDVKLSPCLIKVCMLFILCLYIVKLSAFVLLNSFIRPPDAR